MKTIFKMKFIELFSTTILVVLATGCAQQNNPDSNQNNPGNQVSDYPFTPVDIRNVHINDNFWLPVIERVQEKTIEYAIAKCQEEGRFDNFLIAGGRLEGGVRGQMPFDDTDVYKIIEGASNSLISSPNMQLESLLDSLIEIIDIGQEKDGYLTTWRTINPAKPPAEWVKVKDGVRWESLSMSHEFYNAGHLYEAAAVHYKATGKRNFLDIAIENADLIVETFGPGKIEAVPGHQIIETGLIQLFRITGNKKYLDLAKYFLDTRGDYSSGRDQFGPYAQDHKPVIEQDEVVGHAVRATYMYAGLTDIAAIYQDKDYLNATLKLWENMLEKKIYITGGIGAKHEGESFGENYELPNKTAYNETCASIASVYWNHRLFMLLGEKKYYDVIERTLYNGLISGLSLDGEKFFYPNALESDGIYTFNQGACTRKDWFDCSCCPTNLIRFIPAIPGLIYAKNNDNIFINLYIGNNAEIDLNGQKVKVSVDTNYPWDGKGKIVIETENPIDFTLHLRIPGWANGEVMPSSLYSYANPTSNYKFSNESLKGTDEDGFYSYAQSWNGKHTINFDFPMNVQKVIADAQVAENRGKVSLEYGPIVYAVEEIDNKGSYDDISITGNEKYSVYYDEALLEGVNVLKAINGNEDFLAIPYYAWSNRDIGKMKVWLPAN